MKIIILFIRVILKFLVNIHQNVVRQVSLLCHLIIESEEILFQESFCQFLICAAFIIRTYAVFRILNNSVIHDNRLQRLHRLLQQTGNYHLGNIRQSILRNIFRILQGNITLFRFRVEIQPRAILQIHKIRIPHILLRHFSR